ncbi:MAG: sigma-54-dependent Fis family transcriptional regulator [Polyangiaceae bacterium]|nr:sigma-54-dependent Fis family transcriptional regulator [Polyangiaceae bacterium]
MAAPRFRALVIDRDPLVRRGAARAFTERGIDPLTAEDAAAGAALLASQPADCVLIESDGDGIEAAERIARDHGAAALVLMATAQNTPRAVEAAWALDADVITKPFDPAAAALSAARAVERRRVSREAREARASRDTPAELVGVSEGVRAALRLAAEAARTPSPVLITGENGTGRDAAARFVHDRSKRTSRAFVAVNCTEFEDNPKDAARRLFGDAETSLEGLVHLADRGTLFLDFVDAMTIESQGRLHALLARGAAPGHPIDVRVIAATAVDLREAVRRGTFHEDLYFRLRSLHIHIPPLRARTEDIPLVAYTFLAELRRDTGRDVRRISPEAMRLLRRQPWEHNLRELRSALAHAVALARSEVLLPRDLPFLPAVPDVSPDELFDDELRSLSYAEARKRALAAFEKRYTRVVLDAEEGNKSGGARRAGMDRSNFKRLLRRTKT